MIHAARNISGSTFCGITSVAMAVGDSVVEFRDSLISEHVDCSVCRSRRREVFAANCCDANGSKHAPWTTTKMTCSASRDPVYLNSNESVKVCAKRDLSALYVVLVTGFIDDSAAGFWTVMSVDLGENIKGLSSLANTLGVYFTTEAAANAAAQKIIRHNSKAKVQIVRIPLGDGVTGDYAERVTEALERGLRPRLDKSDARIDALESEVSALRLASQECKALAEKVDRVRECCDELLRNVSNAHKQNHFHGVSAQVSSGGDFVMVTDHREEDFCPGDITFVTGTGGSGNTTLNKPPVPAVLCPCGVESLTVSRQWGPLCKACAEKRLGHDAAGRAVGKSAEDTIGSTPGRAFVAGIERIMGWPSIPTPSRFARLRDRFSRAFFAWWDRRSPVTLVAFGVVAGLVLGTAPFAHELLAAFGVIP